MRRFSMPSFWSTAGSFALIAMALLFVAAADDLADDGTSLTKIEPVEEAAREVIRERFPNGRVKIEREVTQDDRENYLNHGSWKMSDRQGRKVAEGEYRYGKRYGKWTAWFYSIESPLFSMAPYKDFQGPFISQANFRDGRLHGTWTIFDAKQHRISQWSYAEGERDGKWMWWYPNGKKMRELTYDNGEIAGQMTVWNSTGEATVSDVYEEGRKLTRKIEYYEKGQKKSEGTYLMAQRVPQTADDWWDARLGKEVVVGKHEKHGPWIAWFENGQMKTKGEYLHDVEVGPFRWWHSNGQISTDGEYGDGRKSGKWTWWHPNGQKASQGYYKDGTQTGKWSFWAADGKVTQRADFSGGAVRTVETPKKLDKIQSTLPVEKRSTPLIQR